MPDMDGIELEIRLSQLPARPRVIAMTGGGYTSRGDLLEIARRLGADHTLEKPFAVGELVQTVETLVRRPGS